MSSQVWNERTKLAAAAAAAAAGLLVAGLSLVRPTWLFPVPTREPPIPLPEAYTSTRIFDGEEIDTEPTKENLQTTLRSFEEHINDQARELGLTRAQASDLGAVATERLQGMLDPDIERDCKLAVERGLRTPGSDLIAQSAKFHDQVDRLALSSFGLRSAIVIPANHAGNQKYYQQLARADYITQSSNRLPIQPEYDLVGISNHSTRVQVLFPMRVPVLDMKREEFSTSRTAVVVFGFLFAWAETETRQQWVPEKYFQYTHQGTFPQPEDWDDYMVPGYPMAF